MLTATLFAVAGTFGIGMIIGLVVLMTAEEAPVSYTHLTLPTKRIV